MALTATATTETRKEFIGKLNNPVLAITSINQVNISYSVHELKFQHSLQGMLFDIIFVYAILVGLVPQYKFHSYTTIGKHLQYYHKLGHPYVRSYGIGVTFTWVLCMNPLMSELLSTADCIEVDITYRTSVELQYLFHVVAFNYIVMRCMSV